VGAAEKVRIALSVRNVVFLPFYYAKDTRIFDRYGIETEIIQMRSDLQLAGIVSGEIDSIPAVGPATFAVANGMPVKPLAVLYADPSTSRPRSRRRGGTAHPSYERRHRYRFFDFPSDAFRAAHRLSFAA
jgi:hypothetical protein